MATRAKVIVPPEFLQWVEDFADLEDDILDVAEDEWGTVTDVLFSNTQMAVHVISGDLKSSGRSDTYRDGKDIVGEVTYGGTQGTEGPVDYPQYEIDRGGEHDFLAVGWEKSERLFSRALPGIWERVVERMG